MRVLIITSCTGEKAVNHERALKLEDFQKGPEHITLREAELADLLVSAEELYTGQQHVRLMRGVKQFRERGRGELDLWILSAGYGLVPANRKMAPYECTFQGMKKSELRCWADVLDVPLKIREVLGKPYDLGLILLGDSYLEACALDAQVQFGGPTLVFCGMAMAKKLPRLQSLKSVPLANQHAKRFSCALVGLKGELAAKVLGHPLAGIGAVDGIMAHVAEITTQANQNMGQAKREKAQPNPLVDKVISIPSDWWEKPHRSKLKYFIPEWDDLVDPDYDFLTGTHSGGASDWSNEVYAHQLYPEPNYDGILISKVVAEKSVKKKQRINELGVHRFLRVPKEMSIMGDCGAFGYITQDVPPYTTDDILDYYTRLGFDYGVSIDHLIVSATEDTKQSRYELTINNAEEFLREHTKRALHWGPIGAVQGWDSQSYADAARQYVSMGYRYIALGGLVRTTTAEILKILEAVHKVVPNHVSIHLFGLARLHSLGAFADYGVRSVDSASYLRQAWMRDEQGYLTESGSYAAIRIPELGKSFRAKRMLAETGVPLERALILEANALRAVRSCSGSPQDVENAVDAVMEYDRLFGATRKDHSFLYRRTLSERPWKACPCSICQRDGVEVMIFRGNNRNRRRGFHNTYVFYRLLQGVVLPGLPAKTR